MEVLINKVIDLINKNNGELSKLQSEQERLDFVVSLIEEHYPPISRIVAASDTIKMNNYLDRFKLQPVIKAIKQNSFTNDGDCNRLITIIKSMIK